VGRGLSARLGEAGGVTAMMTEGVRVFTVLGPQIREAAERVAKDWPSVTDADDLTRDLSLFLFDGERMGVLLDMPEYRRMKYLVDAAKSLVANEVAEFEYNTGNSLYSVGEVTYLLKSGGLINGRDRITATLPDLDEGCKYLARVLPVYATTLYMAYAWGNLGSHNEAAREAAVRALTDCMNNINQGRKRVARK
jgi:hypothetical protein